MIASPTLAESIAVCGRLGVPAKMPGFAWGLSAKLCMLGSKLRRIAGSICSRCYAFRGNYVYVKVQLGLSRRYRALSHPSWCEHMINMINIRVDQGNDHFRWFDSGDVQGIEHAALIMRVVRGTPDVRHWIATKEWAVWSKFRRAHRLPTNITLRLSTLMIDGAIPRQRCFPLASVSSKGGYYPRAFQCPAKATGNRCGSCRACWDKHVRHVNYVQH